MLVAAFGLGLTFLLVCLSSFTPLAAWAQQAGKVYRVGYLTVPSRATAQHTANAFAAGLRELGWVDGQNVVIDYRFADSNLERLPHLAAELVSLHADVIAAGATPAVLAVRNATPSIPIVMFLAANPVASGLVGSLARPGGNITGLSGSAGPEIYGKQLELLKQAVPRISRVAILVNRVTSPFHALGLREADAASRALGLRQQIVEIAHPDAFDSTFAALTGPPSNAIFVPADPISFQHRARLVDLAARRRLPAMWGLREYAEAGGLMAYGPNTVDLARRAAIHVDKILRGAHPRDLPVEQPTKFDFVINMRTAKALGLTIPSPVLLRADEVIE